MCSKSRHEPMAVHKGWAGPRRIVPDRLAFEAARSRFAPNLAREGWPDYVFAFQEGDEIGPRMLARVGKRTGLTPEDL